MSERVTLHKRSTQYGPDYEYYAIKTRNGWALRYCFTAWMVGDFSAPEPHLRRYWFDQSGRWRRVGIWPIFNERVYETIDEAKAEMALMLLQEG